MDKEQKEQRTSVDLDSSKSKKQYNAGENDSDYDGGHPEDALTEEPKEKQQEHSANDSYNAGGNDSDYDGGHPKDVDPESEGHISSKNKN